eukprot:7384475-Prymnesium_polylepis.1
MGTTHRGECTAGAHHPGAPDQHVFPLFAPVVEATAEVRGHGADGADRCDASAGVYVRARHQDV